MAVTAWMPVPAAQVWALLADARRYREWVCGTRSITAADPQWPESDTSLWCRFGLRFLTFRGRTTVRWCRPEQELALTADVRPLAVVCLILRLHPGSGGVVVELRETVVGGIARLTPRVSERIQSWRNRRSLARLTRLSGQG